MADAIGPMGEGTGRTGLSERELQIARAYAAGRVYREIADELFIAPSTVRTHLSTIYRKLGVSSKLELLRAVEGLDPAGPPEPVVNRESGGLPDRPSIAVLPFQNMSRDAEQDYFADGVVEDIITALSRFKSFAVIARNSSFVYKGRAVDVRQVSNELGVRYVLEGSVRRAGDRLRITAQLIDGTLGAHLWARRFDGVVSDIFDVQDQITESVVAVVEPEIRLAEIERSRRERPGSLAAYDLYLQALPKLYAVAPAENREAFALLSEAIALEPDYGIALSMAAWALSQRIASGWPPAGPDERRRCIELAEAALSSARGDATILATSGLQLVQIGRDYERGMRVIEQAVEANPNNLHVMMRAGIAHLHCGSVDDAMTCFRRALRLSPGDPGRHWSLTGLAQAHLINGECEEALAEAERSHALNGSFGPTYWMLIAATAHLKRLEEARRWMKKFRAVMPGVTVASILAGQPDLYEDRMAAIAEGLRLAGLEEG